jgi:parallel beta-helix repeat protein
MRIILKQPERLLLISSCLIWVFTACGQKIDLRSGMEINKSVVIAKDTFRIEGNDSLSQPAITIAGDGITVDFNNAVLIGSGTAKNPDEFKGLAILVKGRNITIRNAKIRGYKVALLARGVDSLQVIDCDFSYNWRPRLKSIREREDFSDWLSFHNNEKDEWLRYGAAIYLQNCNKTLVRGLTVKHGMNGLMMTSCNEALVYNNNISFNSGIGIGLYKSSRNRIMHNKLDWNVRGYSHGFYQRGQDSAALLVYEQSNENTFAYNSATHSGDGFFLWAGQSTMDSGQGGCNDNLLYRNNFSYAPTNGIEVTFSKNKIVGNIMDECTYGIWGGYSFETLILGNQIKNCRVGVAIEHGQNNNIVGNEFFADSTGIQLWARPSQPADWGYAQKKDVQSRDYYIGRNSFKAVRTPMKISASKKVAINDDNQFMGFEKLLVVEKPNTEFFFVKNDVAQQEGWHDASSLKNMNRLVPALPEFRIPMEEIRKNGVEPLPDGMDASLPKGHPVGRQCILMNEWGPCEFSYPSVWLKKIEGDVYTFMVMGPENGTWKANSGEGFRSLSAYNGSFPAEITAQRKPGLESLSLDLEYNGEVFIDQFGEIHPANVPYYFEFNRFEKDIEWEVKYYNYDSASDPIMHYDVFSRIENQTPVYSEKVKNLSLAWWGSPGKGVNEDKFATISEARFSVNEGAYLLRVTSDDGMKLFLNGFQRMSDWSVHEPQTQDFKIGLLPGENHIKIFHFDNGGFATLQFQLIPIR